jgi:hypothetical protein
MRHRITLLFTVVALLAFTAGVAGVVAGAAVEDGGSGTMADPAEDQIGWENGYWANESLDVDNSDGLNEAELEAVVSRAMARVETVRQVEFERDVPVNVISREEFRNDRSSDRSLPAAYRQRENGLYEALFMVGEDTDAVAVGQQNSGATVGGFFDPNEDTITIISEDTESPKMNEITLAQELFHALQDNQFDTSEFAFAPQERHNANDGVVEGDGNYVDYLYEQRCESEWNCLQPEEESSAGSSDLNLGMYLLSFQPYSDGPAFVQDRYEAGGWDAVNELYENPPASTEQVIHPEKYGSDVPTDVTVEDKSDANWERVSVRGYPSEASVGEAGIFSMLYYPTIKTESTQIIEEGYLTEGQSGPIDPYNYNHPASAGWDGDTMYSYTDGTERGYVWKTEWDSETDAEDFVDAYVDLLQYHGGSSVAGSDDRYRIESGSYADAFEVEQDGTTVTIVNAPTTDELSAVHDTNEDSGGGDAGTCWWFC